MANTSILAAFERMWQHVVTALNNKSDTSHNHDNNYDAKGTASSAVSTHNSSSSAHSSLFNAKQNKPAQITGTGTISLTVANNTEYSYTSVTSLTMTGAAVECCGFITFGASKPAINVNGFAASSGDDITAAAANEIWEFSVDNHAGKAYIIWKNWSA